LFAVKVQSSDGFRALLKREQGATDWTPIETKMGVKNSGKAEYILLNTIVFSQ
jgi:hypothetical protein